MQNPNYKRRAEFARFEAIEAATEFATGGEMLKRYQGGADTLLGAILAAPHEAAIRQDEIDPVFWKDTQHYGAAIAVCKALAAKQDISPKMVAISAGADVSPLYALMAENSAIGVGDALTLFLPVYRIYVEWIACTTAIYEGNRSGLDAESVRGIADKVRAERKQYIQRTGPNFSDLDTWVESKLSGIAQDLRVTPHLATIVESKLATAWEPGEMIVVGGISGIGKTHFIVGEILHHHKNGCRGLFISADMHPDKVRKRMFGPLARVNPRADWSLASDEDRHRISAAYQIIKSLDCVMVGDLVDVDQIIALAIAENYKKPLDYIIVDHINIITRKGAGNATEITTAVSAALKHLSKVLNVPMIVLAQLDGKDIRKRSDKRPHLGDVRQSFAIVQDAARVIFIHRPEAFDISILEDGSDSKERAEIIFAKQQEDRTGYCTVGFNGVRGFYDIEAPVFSSQFPVSQYRAMPANRAEPEDFPF